MDNKWENKIKDALEDFTQEEPEGLWVGVESGLRPSTRAFSPTLAAGIALAVAASFAIVGIFLFKGQENSIENRSALALVDDSVPVPDRVEELSAAADAASAHSASAPSTSSQASPYAPSSPSSPASSSAALTASSAPSSTSLSSSSASSSITVAVSASLPNSETNVSEAEKSGVTETEVRETAPVEVEMSLEEFLARKNATSSGRSSRLSLALSYAGAGSRTNEMEGYSGFNCSALAGSFWNAENATESSRRYSAVLHGNIDRNVGTKVIHRQPLQLALTAEYKLPQGVGIETGLVYSRLVSELTSGTEVTNYKTIQTLDYLGVPLSLNFSFVDSKQYRLYLATGAMLEKCISGKSYTDYYYMEAGHYGETESISVKPVQWSANFSLGSEVGVFKFVKLYFEPGLRYNFKSDTPVETIYSERTLNFNLRCGLRFSL